MQVIIIVVGIGLVVGAFYSSWMMWKIIKDIELKKKNKKN